MENYLVLKNINKDEAETDIKVYVQFINYYFAMLILTNVFV